MVNSGSLSRRYDRTLLKINASDLYLLQTSTVSWKHIWSRSIRTKGSQPTARSTARYVSITLNAILASNDDGEIVWLRTGSDVWGSFFDMMSWSRLAMLCWISLVFGGVGGIAHYTQLWSLNVTRWADYSTSALICLFFDRKVCATSITSRRSERRYFSETRTRCKRWIKSQWKLWSWKHHDYRRWMPKFYGVKC